MEPFIVNIADLIRRDTSPRPVRVEAPVTWTVDTGRVLPDPPLHADLTLQGLSGDVLVRGTVRYSAVHVCSRCLDEYRTDDEITIAALFEAEPVDDGYQVDGDMIDLEPMVRDEVLLGLPLLPDCGDGCRGVVTTPESDLNTGFPDPGGEPASPFASLRDLFGPGNDE